MLLKVRRTGSDFGGSGITKPVNWGILGASHFALNHMGPAIHAALGARLFALATSGADKAAPFRAFCPDLRVHSSYDELLADPQIEAVYIPLPNHLHVEWAMKALASGKHVLCEKPIAMHAGEIDALIAARDASGLLAAEAFMIVHHPQWQRAKVLYEDGAIGQLVHVDAAFSFFNDDAGNIRNRPETGGGGLRDIGVYTFGSTRYLTGEEPTRITHANIRWENKVDTYAHVLADFPEFSYSGLTSTRLASRQEMVFHGVKGVMRITAPFNAELFGEPKVELYRPGGVDIIERFPGVNQYQNQVRNFANTIRTGAEYLWSLENARGTQHIIDMVFEAARA